MSERLLLLLVMTTAVCGTASAGTLVVSVDGHFSNSDSAGPLVAPNGAFNIQFKVDNNPTPLNGSVTALGFDIPLLGFTYTLNGILLNVTPSEIRFNTLGNGGLFDV